MLGTRVLTAIIAVPILLFILYQGGLFWTGLFVLIATIGLFEFYSMISSKGLNPSYLLGFILMYIILFSSHYIEFFPLILFVFIVLTVLFTLFQYPERTIGELSLSLFGSVYIGFLSNYAIKIGSLNESFIIIILALLLTWSSDVGGYFFGRLWGNSKIAPLISPNKTWAGAIGGVLLSIVTATIFLYTVPLGLNYIIYGLVIGFISSLMAQFGDLFISSLKRYCGVKDSGHIIPGHGGVLDRFDSFILVLPTVYYFFYFFVNSIL